MTDYIATFYTHFGAVSFNRTMKGKAAGVRMMPVPRALSSSCGTCVRFCLSDAGEDLRERGFPAEECPDLEAVYEVRGDSYACVFQAEEPL